jgi:hypothetical protein
MKENFPSPRKFWRPFSFFINVIFIVSIITPYSNTTAYALGIPQLTYPGNYASTTPDSDPPLGIPSFSWTYSPGANIYHLQVDNDISFAEPIFLDITTQNSSFTPQSPGHLFDDGEWYWRVRVEDPAPAGHWSLTFRFTKNWETSENKPILIAPDDGVSIPLFSNQIFSWEPVIGAAKYRFQIASNEDFTNLVWSVDTLTSTHQPNIRLTNGLYYWRVIPINIANQLGAPSETRYFNMVYGYGDMRPVLLEPQDHSHPAFTPTFLWEPVIGAELYHLEYTSDENCDYGVGISIITRQTSFTPTTTFANDKWYCWHVRIESGQL